MIIDLDSTKYYFLTTGTNPRRRTHMLELFGDYSLTEVRPPLDVSKYKSGSVGVSRMLDLGVKHQERGEPFRPFVFLEDDVSWYRDFPRRIQIPDAADLLFVGISRCGLDTKTMQWCHDLVATDVGADVVRVFNMLSAHGIMVCSPTGALAYQRCMMESFFTDTPWDVHIAALLPFYNAFALKVPLVYQDAEYGGQEKETRFELTDYRAPSPSEFVTDTVSYLMSAE